MTIHLLNAAFMPAANGYYQSREIREEEFITRLQDASTRGRLKAFIGYPSLCELILEKSGVSITPNRDETTIAAGDELLIIKLKRRPPRKGEFIAKWHDYEFRIVEFSEPF